eukprot:COSAG01_NODE_3277_length_6316_cov_10.522921_7_plen_71_part_00
MNLVTVGTLTEPNVVLPFLQRLHKSLDCPLYILQSHHQSQESRVKSQANVSALHLTSTGEEYDAGHAPTH